MPKFYRQNKKRIDPRYFLNETTNRDLEEAWDVEENPEREEEERRFKAGEDNPWGNDSQLSGDELIALGNKMNQNQGDSSGSQFTREQEKQMSDDVEDFIKKYNASIGLNRDELDRLNRVMDGLWDNTLPKKEIPAIADALKRGDQGLIDYFRIQTS